MISEAPSPRQRKRVSTADLEVSRCALLHGELGVKPNGKSGVFLEEHSSVLPSFLPAASSFKTSLLQRQVLEQVWPARTALRGNKGWKMEGLNNENKLGRLPRRFPSTVAIHTYTQQAYNSQEKKNLPRFKILTLKAFFCHYYFFIMLTARSLEHTKDSPIGPNEPPQSEASTAQLSV